MDIVAFVSEQASNRSVRRVKLEIGKLSAVMPDAIRFCFDVCAQGTLLEGATLEIDEIEGRARCNICAAEAPITLLSGNCICGSTDIVCIAGEELRIKEMEVA